MTDKPAYDLMVLARTSLLLDHFFFGRLAMHLKLTEDTTLPTLAVDGVHLFYNPKFIHSLSAALRKSAVVHEVMHCVCEHVSRCMGRDHEDWNRAGDYSINGLLKKNGFQLGEGWLHNTIFDGMSAEEIYKIIHKENQDKGKSSPYGSQPLCDIRNAAKTGPDTVNQEISWQIAVQGAAKAAKEHGKVPAGMERFFDVDVTPKVNWRDALHHFFDQMRKNDYTMKRPNRRFMHYGLYLPTLAGEGMGTIVVAVDTSGSIDGPTLSAFGAEIRAVQLATKPEKIVVIYCDAKVNRVDEFGPDDEVELVGVGGGGTSFIPPFEHVEAHDINPKAFIYLTDMYGPFPNEPEYPVMWAATTDVEGPFGTTIKVEL